MIKTLRDRGARREIVAHFFQTIGVAAIIGLPLILFNQRVGDFVAPLVPDPYIEVVSLEFRDGKVWQQVRAVNAEQIRGTWSAGINSEDRFVCSGGGVAPYFDRRAPVGFTPDEWTGDDCSDLSPGETYTARATWEWLGSDGKARSTSKAITFVWQPGEGT